MMSLSCMYATCMHTRKSVQGYSTVCLEGGNGSASAVRVDTLCSENESPQQGRWTRNMFVNKQCRRAAFKESTNTRGLNLQQRPRPNANHSRNTRFLARSAPSLSFDTFLRPRRLTECIRAVTAFYRSWAQFSVAACFLKKQLLPFPPPSLPSGKYIILAVNQSPASP